ncbi:MAG: hypothetical protein R2799_01855 [Crocinitomicaceae bacterium]
MTSLLFGLLCLINFHDHQLIDSSEDEKQVQKSVEKWVDDNIAKWEGMNFDKFHAYYTEEFEMQSIKVNMYKSQLENLERRKKMDKYTGTEEEFDEEKKALKEKISKTKDKLKDFKPRVTYYEIYMWSNIQTKNGLTLYMEIYFKLNDDYEVTSHKINSSIGGDKDPSKNEIMYKKN